MACCAIPKDQQVSASILRLLLCLLEQLLNPLIHLIYIIPMSAVKIAADLEQLATLEAKAAQTVGIEDLPQHIKECEAEIGALSRRIAELKAEILWARGEIEHRVKEGDEWERLLSHRRSRVNRLKVQEAELREQEVFAHARAVEAARDAHEPAAWAKVKAEEAAALKAVIGDSSPADSEEESSSSVESAK